MAILHLEHILQLADEVGGRMRIIVIRMVWLEAPVVEGVELIQVVERQGIKAV